MAKNRKYQSAAIRFGPALKAFLLCLLIGGSGVGYVWQKSQIYELGKMIKARENRLAELRDQNKKLSDQLAMLRSPRKLEDRVRELNLGLGQPRPASVVRLLEPVSPQRLETGPSVAARANAAP
jgi:hypothetical protein